MKLLILLSCILGITVAVPVRRSASGSSSGEHFQVPPQLLPLPNQPQLPPQVIPFYVAYDPAQGLLPFPPNLPSPVNPVSPAPGGPVLFPFPGFPGFPAPVPYPGNPVAVP
ncbi:uncharacterized protein LOC133363745 [Rhineura floridana]|uniref:uncharacterized protein LOC133363745 n=1 Tax=Rhineura floridana TaxID=261503 RepID=UPI002AC80048|nr:uncharacterized protein LOC133363745 [Rhineura floridana]